MTTPRKTLAQIEEETSLVFDPIIRDAFMELNLLVEDETVAELVDHIETLDHHQDKIRNIFNGTNAYFTVPVWVKHWLKGIATRVRNGEQKETVQSSVTHALGMLDGLEAIKAGVIDDMVKALKKALTLELNYNPEGTELSTEIEAIFTKLGIKTAD